MSLTLSKSELKPKLLGYLRQLETHKEPIVVTDHGKPVAKIIPYTEDAEDILRELAHSVLHYEDPFEPVGLEDWDLLP